MRGVLRVNAPGSTLSSPRATVLDPPAPLPVSLGLLVELIDGTYQPTADRSEATHHHVLTDADNIDVAVLTESKAGLREAILGSTLILYGF